MALVSEMRQQLTRFLSGQVSVEDLQSWMDQRCAEIGADELASRLFAYVEWAFCDLENGKSSQEQLELGLRRIAVQPVFDDRGADVFSTSGTSSTSTVLFFA